MRLAMVLCCLASSLRAETTCDDAAVTAAQESGVPLPILTAITRVETGQSRNGVAGPWPWTINHAGQGEWFDSAESALARIDDLLGDGAQIDIGCFQINTRWHAQEFATAADMLDPEQNARYAARYLTELHAEAGDWQAAVAAYHSRDPDRGAGYADKVAAMMRDPATPITLPETAAPRINRFPLLVAGTPFGGGSLFAAQGLTGPLIGR